MSGATPSVQIGDGCTACGLCVITCPTGALIPARHRPTVLEDRCTGCWACVEVCPRGVVAPTGPTGTRRPAPVRLAW